MVLNTAARAFARATTTANANRLPDAHASADERPGHDEAGAPDGEHAIDGNQRAPRGRRSRQRIDERKNRGSQPGDAVAGARRGPHDGPQVEPHRRHCPSSFLFRERRPLGVCDVRLGDGDEHAANAEQLGYTQVLAGLGHHAVVGGDGEEQRADARCAGDHRVHQAPMSGDVDEAHRGAR